MARRWWPEPSPRGTSPCCDNTRDREPEAQVTPGKELTAVVNFVMRATFFKNCSLWRLFLKVHLRPYEFSVYRIKDFAGWSACSNYYLPVMQEWFSILLLPGVFYPQSANTLDRMSLLLACFRNAASLLSSKPYKPPWYSDAKFGCFHCTLLLRQLPFRKIYCCVKSWKD